MIMVTILLTPVCFGSGEINNLGEYHGLHGQLSTCVNSIEVCAFLPVGKQPDKHGLKLCGNYPDRYVVFVLDKIRISAS